MPRIDDTPELMRIREDINAKGIKGLSPGMVQRNPKTELEPLVMDGLTDNEIGVKRGISSVSICMLRKYHGLPNCLDVREMLACVQDETEPDPVPIPVPEPEPVPDDELPADQGELENCFAEVEDWLQGSDKKTEQPLPVPLPREEIIRNLVMETFAPLSDRLKRETNEMLQCFHVNVWQERQKILDEVKKEAASEASLVEPEMLEPQECELPLLSIEKPAQLVAPLVNGIAKYLDRMGDEQVEVIVTVRRVNKNE